MGRKRKLAGKPRERSGALRIAAAILGEKI